MENRNYCGDIAEEIEMARKNAAFLYFNQYITEKEFSKIKKKCAEKQKKNGIFVTENFETVRKMKGLINEN